jgi:hypothetical protein
MTIPKSGCIDLLYWMVQKLQQDQVVRKQKLNSMWAHAFLDTIENVR